MITTKADKLLRSLIDAGLSLTDFTILATKVMRIQRDFKTDNEGRRQRDRLRQQDKLREEYNFEQQLKEEEQRKMKGLAKLRELGYVTNDDTTDNFDQQVNNQSGDRQSQIKGDRFLLPYSKEMNEMKQKQRDCCLTFNIDYDLRLNQQALERACRRAKRNIYELRAERFNRPDHRSILSVETATLHNKLKEAIREINKIFHDSKSDQDKRYLQELLTYINQFEGDIDLLMCQMQYEPKVKETILFAPVTTDILDRMNLILYYVRTLANRISTGDYTDNQNDNIEQIDNNLSNIPTKVTYIIKIKTNNEVSSSLSDETNVTIKCYGTNNKSPEIRLVQSINKNKWQSGQIDLFNIEFNYLGDIYAIEIWHDSQYSSWKVDWVEIIDDAANIYRFPIDRLFDKYSNENKTRFIIQRDIGPVNRLPSKPLKQIKPYKQIGFSTYTVQVKTGKQPNKATDSSIFIQLKGENGTFADNLCSANSAFKGSVFEPDQLDTFYLVWPNLAKIDSLHLLVQSEGINPSWFCEYVTIEDSQTGDRYKFILNQLFDGSNSDDPNLKRHLTVYPENTNQEDKKEEKEKPSYLMKIKTGEKGLSTMSTLPPINLILKGEKGKSDPYTLKSSDNKRKLFRENQTDEFILPSKYYIGPVKALQLSANDQIDKWFIETIIIRDIAQGQDYTFPIYQWINTADGTNSLTVQPINGLEQKPDYIVYTRTKASELKGPDRRIKLTIQGDKGKNKIELNNPVTMYNTFQPGRKDEYYVENMKSLGDLQSIEVDITHPNIEKLGLDYIEIKDTSTKNSYRFDINRMLDSKNPKMIAKAEPILRSNVSSIKTNRNLSNQLPLPNTGSKHFDQSTTSVPQGSKRPTDDSSLTGSKNKKESQYTIDSTATKSHSNIPINIKNSISEHDQSSIIDSKKDIYQNTKLHSDINAREMSQPQGSAAPSTTTTNKSNTLSKLADSILSENDEDDFSLPNNTITSSISQNISLSEKLNSSSSRQIRPGDRVKNSSKRQLTNHPSILSSLHEADWYHRSVETNKEHRDEAKQIQLISDKHISQTKFNQQQARIIQNKKDSRRSNENQKENKMNSIQNKGSLLPKKSSSRSLKNAKINNINNRSSTSNSQQHLNELKTEMNRTSPKKSNVFEQNQITRKDDRILSAQQLPINQKLDNDRENYPAADVNSNIVSSTRDDSRRSSFSKRTSQLSSSSTQAWPDNQKSTSRTKYAKDTDDPSKMMVVIQSPTPSNISELTNYNEKTTFVRSKTSGLQSQKGISQDRTPLGSNVTDTNSIITESSDIFMSNKKMAEAKATTPTSFASFKSDQKSATYRPSPNPSKSVPPSSRSPSDASARRSLSVSSSRTLSNTDNQIFPGSVSGKSSSISKDQSKQPIDIISSPNSDIISQMVIPSANASHISQLTSKTTTHSTGSQNRSTELSRTSTSNKTPTGSFSVSTTSSSNPKQPLQTNSIIIDPSFDDNNSQPNTHGISAVSIHTIATKSDSDSNLTRRSIDSRGSEHSLQNKALLSPDAAKKNRKKHRQKTSENTQNEQISISESSINNRDPMAISKLNNHISSASSKYLSKESSDIQYASRPPSTKSPSDNTLLPVELKPSDNTSRKPLASQGALSTPSRSYADESLTQETSNVQFASRASSTKSSVGNIPLAIELKPSGSTNRKAQASRGALSTSSRSYVDESLAQEASNVQFSIRSATSEDTKSKSTTNESRSKDNDISLQYSSKPSLNASTVTDISSISSKTTTQSHILPEENSDLGYNTTPKKTSISTKTSSNLSSKRTGIDQMSTVYEESEPSTGGSAPNLLASSLTEHDSNEENIQDWLETSSTSGSSHQNLPLNHMNEKSSSTTDSNIKNLTNKTIYPSNHYKKTIDAKSRLTSIKSNTSIDYEFRVQTGNESQLDGTNEPVSIELMNTKGRSITIPLINSMNNSKPFQKGQLDIFHLHIPKNFHTIEKLNISLPKSNKDPLHIRYCELQDHQTMTTLYFPIEKWLGENNTYNVEMYINNNNNSLF